MYDSLESILKKQIDIVNLRLMSILCCALPGLVVLLSALGKMSEEPSIFRLCLGMIIVVGGVVVAWHMPIPRFPKGSCLYEIRYRNGDNVNYALFVAGEDAMIVYGWRRRYHLRKSKCAFLGLDTERWVYDRKFSYSVEVKQGTDKTPQTCEVVFEANMNPDEVIIRLLRGKSADAACFDNYLFTQATRIGECYEKGLSEEALHHEIALICDEVRANGACTVKGYNLLNKPAKKTAPPTTPAEEPEQQPAEEAKAA